MSSTDCDEFHSGRQIKVLRTLLSKTVVPSDKCISVDKLLFNSLSPSKFPQNNVDILLCSYMNRMNIALGRKGEIYGDLYLPFVGEMVKCLKTFVLDCS